MPYVAILLTMNSATLNHSKFLMSYLHKTETVNEKSVIHGITVFETELGKFSEVDGSYFWVCLINDLIDNLF